ncbi:MAG: TlpA family protein disulfide reductase [Candidatus Omnitrophica bacterium]|nr:TlpA family protein disulfide reductase [Candidatus Omnitrophota bacterium]
MKKYLNIMACVIISLFLASCSQAQEGASADKGGVRDFTLQDIDNTTYTLSSYRNNQPVVLFFWTTWCSFCQREIKSLQEHYPEIAKQGAELFAIDAGESAATVRAFIKSQAYSFKVLLDTDGKVANSFGVIGVPTFVLIDKSGEIVATDHSFPQEKFKEITSG